MNIILTREDIIREIPIQAVAEAVKDASIRAIACPTGEGNRAAGPTASYRMDPFASKLLEIGLKGMIGKGKRSGEVTDN